VFVVSLVFSCAALGQSSSSSSSSSPSSSHSTLSALPEAPKPVDHFDLYVGAAYSSANQVKSSSALVGGTVALDGKLKPWFGGTVDYGYYGFGYGLVKPTMYTMLAGPAFFLSQGKYEGYVHVLFGLAHTGGVGATPNLAYAYAIGGGMQYDINRRFAVRLAGDGIFSAFAIDPLRLGYSQNMRVNPRATGGIVYHF
jgi:hypothetical protein